jgi:DNA-directed RNA polymerase specialized sigma24 family protein
LAAVISLYYRPLKRFFCKVLLADEDLGEDVTQEFFTRFVERDFLKNLREETSFRGFLRTAARRHYLNWCGRRHTEVPAPRPPVAADQEFDLQVRAWYLEEALRRCRVALEAKGKRRAWEVFEARVRFDGAKPEDYASLSSRFGIGVYEVRNQLTVARKVFRRLLLEIAAERAGDARQELAELDLLRYVAG